MALFEAVSSLIMANTNEQILSTGAEEALFDDDRDLKEKTPATALQDPLFSMPQNVNKILGAMADSILNMNQSLKRLHPSNVNPKQRKHSFKDEMSASDGSDEDEDDSDVEFQALCSTEADKTFQNQYIMCSTRAKRRRQRPVVVEHPGIVSRCRRIRSGC